MLNRIFCSNKWQVFLLAKNPLYSKIFASLLVGNLFFWFSTSLFMPVLPLHYHRLGFSEAQIGMAVGAFSCGALMFRFLAGKAIDRYGSKLVLTAGMMLSLIAVAGYPLGQAVIIAVAVRLLHGIGISGYGSAALTTTTLMFDSTRTTEAVSMYTLFTMIGSGLAASSALWLYTSFDFTGVVVAGISATALSLILFPKQETKKTQQNSNVVAVWEIIAQPSVYLSAGSLFIINFCYSTIITFLPLYVLARGADGMRYFFVAYAIAVVLSRLVVNKVCQVIAAPKLSFYLIMSFGIIMLFTANYYTYYALATAGVAVGISFGFAFPSLAGFVAQQTSEEQRGTAFGFFITGHDLGQVAGAVGMGFIVGLIGYKEVFSAIGILTLSYGFLYRIMLMPKLIKIDKQLAAIGS